MFIAHEVIRSLIQLVNIFFTILYWLLVIRIVLAWFGISPYTTYHELLGILYQVTDYILRPLRKLPLQFGMLDFSVIVAFVVLQFLQRVIVGLLLRIGGGGGGF